MVEHYLYENIAQGGPLDGIKVAAPGTWDGRIAIPKKGRFIPEYYPGAYRWDLNQWTWVWHFHNALPTAA